MHEILERLPAGAKALDLGSGAGSFGASYPVTVICADLVAPESGLASQFVQLDAASLSFKTASLDAVVLNHSLEHFARLEPSLTEVGRVLKLTGAAYFSVPDSSTLSDRLYRWMGKGGGHVNQFNSLERLVSVIQQASGLRLRGVRLLCSSFAFLNARNLGPRRLRKYVLFLGGNERLLAWFTFALRLVDRLLRTRTAVYGWGLYFGHLETAIAVAPWTNVCIRCGAGHPSAWLESTGCVARGRLLRWYPCPRCGVRNLFTRDDGYRFMTE
jgi:SAM-dependent methyltransferase